MTDLQASLIAIGIAIVVGVISYNRWHEYKAKKNLDRVFSSTHDDVLMTTDTPSAASGERREPVFTADTSDIDAALDGHARAFDAPNDDGAPQSFRARESLSPIRMPMKDPVVDDLVDCIIPLSLDGPVRGEKVLPVLQSLRLVGNKPVRFVGQCEDGIWEAVGHGGIYLSLQAGLQLANRSSALNELEYSEFIMQLRQVADELGAEPDVPDMIKVMTAARGLHQFVSEYDAQLSVNVASNGAPWAISTLLGALERQGFDVRPDGRLVMSDGENGMLFSISTNASLSEETTSRLTLLLDVPRVAPSLNGFGAMAACAKSLAARLDGTVVDDANQPLTQEALEQIAAQVNAFYGDMDAAEIPAGSPRALRLFS